MWQPGSLYFDEIEGNIVLDEADDIVVAGPIYKFITTAGGENVRVVDKENGRLFAAAPDLLEALEDILTYVVPGGDDDGWMELWDNARKALEKARGEG